MDLSQTINNATYKKIKKLGKGNYGDVILAERESDKKVTFL